MTSHVSSWQRRDSHSSVDKPAQKQSRTYSRSRSRSPVGSYRSHYSSHGRSRSRSRSLSLSPPSKRRRREYSHPPAREHSPAPARSRSPSDRGRPRLTSDQDRRHSESSPSHRSRRSLSSASSVSTDRSRSRGSPGRPRAVHRLPTASTSAVRISPTLLGRNRGNTTQNQTPQRNGKNNSNGKQKVRLDCVTNFAIDTDGFLQRTNAARKQSLVETPSMKEMPPPRVLPASLPPRPQLTAPEPSIPTASPEERSHGGWGEIGKPTAADVIPARTAPTKGAGFIPIKPATSSLKRFFPGDEDETDHEISAVPPPSTSELSGGDMISEALPLQNIQDMSEERQLYNPNDTVPDTPVESSRVSGVHDTGPSMPPSPYNQRRPSSVSEDNTVPSLGSQKVDAAPHQVGLPVAHHEQLEETGISTPAVNSRSELYAIVSQVGEGTFGKVYKARNTVTNVHVALKRIRMEAEKDGFPVTAMREIKLLQSLRHENVIRLYEMMVSNGKKVHLSVSKSCADISASNRTCPHGLRVYGPRSDWSPFTITVQFHRRSSKITLSSNACWFSLSSSQRSHPSRHKGL